LILAICPGLSNPAHRDWAARTK